MSLTARKIAHEINNPLGIITNYLTTMRLKLSGEDDVQEELEIIGEEIQRISSLISQMDLFSQSSPLRFALTSVNSLIEDIVQLIKTPLFTALGRDITFRPDALLPQVMTSGDALKQVMINLLKNASEALGEGGSVEVRTGRCKQDVLGSEVRRAEGIEIVVEDTGPGLPESVLKNMYKPFVTTKKNGHSGLGLSIIHTTIADLGGSISCTSRPAEGTSFFIYLPLGDKDLQTRKKQ